MGSVEHRLVDVARPAQPLTWPTVAGLLAPHSTEDEFPLRLALVAADDARLRFEMSVLKGVGGRGQRWGSLWEFRPRRPQRTGRFVAVQVVPTGVRAEIGGFSGDATPATNLLAAVCDYVLTHPNCVTASDLYWARDNVLYLEGNLLSRFLTGMIHLLPRQTRRLGLLVDSPRGEDLLNNVLNAVNAARAVGGLELGPVWVCGKPLRASVFYSDSGRALGDVTNLGEILDLASQAARSVDALAITSEIAVDPGLRADYYAGKEVPNPWGGVEALLTHAVTTVVGLPAAHAPMLTLWEELRVEGPVDPRDAAEVISMTFLVSVLRGLAAAPQPVAADAPVVPGDTRLTAEDVGAVVLPASAVGGVPAFAALAQGIPLVLVTENETISELRPEDLVPPGDGVRPEIHVVGNYLEAAGVLVSLRERLSLESLRRPIPRAEPLQLPGGPAADE
ncbi:Protein of unknown function (DUF3326) [Streptoalloteichus tenebrarius]|uniref:DUF3326 domain-containing protein n=1 Tax=Streptoalloteichus tenebrarius (strain ATCC 17920 / DSM 40477 / JCM 4838 / CBS 697.72 / NBRC 16177 / NCIMB 11028 / NRRL B-12390 / A12253. 1 / ISP 5477) TaxID=1933 RepID=A0ABT1HWA5_STRSD|nr:DUF3326 domain-containing protein [Streptoalloteichus tenebrarius]MCP2259796.1 Protein of unknown function (DUF3326) [Streptoalloteichus tenebrarius]BFE99258.1 DUF3326 domain-containing protein [Streptoalloteichus tenebrarius]